MIFELYGLPGSGKTFMINKIMGNLLEKTEKESIIKKTCIKMAKKFSIWMPSSIKLKKQIYSIIQDASLTPLYIKREVHTYIDNIIMVAFGYKWNRQHMIYMDEGIIHRIVSFAVNYNLTIEQVFLIINLFKKQLNRSFIVYLDVDINICLDGIQNRKRHICEMDELSKEKLECYLYSYKHYFDIINTKYNHIKINREHEEKLEELLK